MRHFRGFSRFVIHFRSFYRACFPMPPEKEKQNGSARFLHRNRYEIKRRNLLGRIQQRNRRGSYYNQEAWIGEYDNKPSSSVGTSRSKIISRVREVQEPNLSPVHTNKRCLMKKKKFSQFLLFNLSPAVHMHVTHVTHVTHMKHV